MPLANQEAPKAKMTPGFVGADLKSLVTAMNNTAAAISPAQTKWNLYQLLGDTRWSCRGRRPPSRFPNRKLISPRLPMKTIAQPA